MPVRWNVVEVTADGERTLRVRFADGLQGRVRFADSFFTGVFEKLRDPRFFAQVHVDQGAVAWPGDVDLAPDAMYEEIRKRGE